MVVYSVEMATYIGAGKTYVAMTGSPFAPLTNGRLVQLKLILYGSAVTALIEGVTILAECPAWGGVPVTISGAGARLRTAPAFPIEVIVQNCDVPIKTGVNITLQIKNVTADTPVTVEATLIGVFEA